MGTIYLKIASDESSIEAYGSLASLKALTNSEDYAKAVSSEEWEAAGSKAYLENGSVILGSPKSVIIAEAEDYIRRMRHKLLKINCDRISPMRWELLTSEQQDEVRAYRQALLDITKNDGFPWVGKQDEIPWPAVPEFIGDEFSRGITSLD